MIERAQLEEGQGTADARFLLIGNQVIDRGRNLILREGELHRVEPKAMAVLDYLAAAGGRIVSRQELMREVWGVHVVDEAVQRAISVLRAALDPDGRNGPIVETVRGKGYRLAIGPAAIEGPAAQQQPEHWKLWLYLAVTFAAGVLIAVVAMTIMDREALAPSAPAASSSGAPAAAPPAP